MVNKSYVIRISMTVAMGGFLLGFDSALISGVVPFIKEKFSLNELMLGWSVSSMLFAVLFGTLTAGVLSDAFGRRKVLFFTAILFTLSALGSALANVFWFFVVARMIGGLAIGLAILIAPMFIAEVSPADKRGSMVSLNQLMIVIGISLAYFSNYFLLDIGEANWRWMLGVEAFPAMLFFVLLFFVPESPRWLVSKGEEEKAINILRKVNGPDRAAKIMDEIKDSLINITKAKISELFVRRFRFVLFIGITLGIFQQITGINAVFYYAPVIFEKTGIGRDAAFVQAIFVGLTNLAFTLLAIRLIDRLGRKPLLIIGSGGILISHALLSWAFHQNNLDSLLVLFAILGFIASFAISLGPVMWVMLSEIFPNKFRGLAISVAGFANGICSFLVTMIFPWELEKIGPSNTFLIYVGFAFLTLLFVIFFIPETKNKSLEELEVILTPEKSR